jgi:hypothetical protein
VEKEKERNEERKKVAAHSEKTKIIWQKQIKDRRWGTEGYIYKDKSKGRREWNKSRTTEKEREKNMKITRHGWRLKNW